MSLKIVNIMKLMMIVNVLSVKMVIKFIQIIYADHVCQVVVLHLNLFINIIVINVKLVIVLNVNIH